MGRISCSPARRRDSAIHSGCASSIPRRPHLLLKTEGGSLPFWAPDGRRIGFFAGGNLKRIDLSNGSVETICPAGSGRGATWSKDDVIVFSAKSRRALMRVSALGGAAKPLTSLTDPADVGHAWPEFLPDGRRVLYYARVRTASVKVCTSSVSIRDGRGDCSRSRRTPYPCQPVSLLFIRITA
jgi:hypothetical protein